MENKMTAVEWLLLNVIISGVPQSNSGLSIDDVRDQALQMEKEQIMNAHLIGLIYPLNTNASKQAEQYYTETYGKETDRS